MRLRDLFKIICLIIAPIWFEFYKNALFCARLDLYTASATARCIGFEGRAFGGFLLINSMIFLNELKQVTQRKSIY
jgi:hypothetical protein